jgi:hypothetical protein
MIIVLTTEQLRATDVGPLVLLAKMLEANPGKAEFDVDTEAFDVDRRTAQRSLDLLAAWGIVKVAGAGRVRRVSLVAGVGSGFAGWFAGASDVSLFYPRFYPLVYDLLRSEYPDLPQTRFDRAVKESLAAAACCTDRPAEASIVQWVKRAIENEVAAYSEDRSERAWEQPKDLPESTLRMMYGDDWEETLYPALSRTPPMP